MLKSKITEKNIQGTTNPSEFAKNVSKDNEIRDWSTAPEPPQHLQKIEEEVNSSVLMAVLRQIVNLFELGASAHLGQHRLCEY